MQPSKCLESQEGQGRSRKEKSGRRVKPKGKGTPTLTNPAPTNSRRQRIVTMEPFKIKRRALACTTHDVLKQARELAHTSNKLPVPPQEPLPSLPMLPVSVSVELVKQDTELREHLLYKLGDASWDPKATAIRMAWTVGLSEKEEKGIEADFSKAIAPFKRYGQAYEKGLGPITNDMRVLLPVYVKRGHLVLRDELDLHMGSLGGVGSAMATAVQTYAAQVCRDLKLNPSWFGALVRYVGTLFSDVNEDIKATGTSELLITPGSDGRLRSKPSGLPRLEEVTPELEAAERERTRRRDEKVLARQRLRKVCQEEAQTKAQADAHIRSLSESNAKTEPTNGISDIGTAPQLSTDNHAPASTRHNTELNPFAAAALQGSNGGGGA